MIPRINTTQLTRELIGISSVSGSETAIAEFILEYLEGHGFAPRLVAGRFSERDWINVVCESGARNSKRIALNAHIDTVPAGDGWETNPLEAVERGGKIYGRGAADMKAGLAAQLNAFVELGDTYDLILTAVSDEEGISRGTNALADQGIYNGCSAAIFSEPNTSVRNESDYEIRIGGRGRYVFEVHVRTAGGHGAKEKRANAILEASRFLNEVHEFETDEHPIMGRARYNIESIGGGAGGFLSTPNHCVVQISRFALIGENLESCKKRAGGNCKRKS
ncbi:MAG TPA: M20/M25/M40 family metallo-hydrolase [archaeon]|nr:M20/M25/M40 family metallo-hydrolase [archaeon]